MTKDDRWLVILNPNAGGKQAITDWPMICEELILQGFQFDMVETKWRMHAVTLVQHKIEEGYRKIISIGGDGTLHEVANGIMMQNTVPSDNILLAIISVGTGNDWIRTHNISSNYKEAIQQIKEGKTIFQDVGKIVFKGHTKHESRYFINSVGIGFDARVVRYIQPKKEMGKHGKSIYINGLIRSLFTNKNIKSMLHLDQKRLETKVYNLTVGLCRFKGGGFKMLPNAVPDDGKLDVTLASRISKRKLLASLPKIFTGKVDQIRYFDFFQIEELLLDFKKPICTEADGEFLGYHPQQITILPNRLRIVSGFHGPHVTY